MKCLYQDISNTKNHTYNCLKKLMKNQNLFAQSGYKEYSVIIMNKQD